MTIQQKARLVLSTPRRERVIRIRDGTALRVTLFANDEGGDARIIYRWPTPLSPREFLEQCVPLKDHPGFREQVEVVTFPSERRSASEPEFEVVSYDRFLEDGGPLGNDVSTVRFNADSVRLGPFSLIWTPFNAEDPQVRGEIQAIFTRQAVAKSQRGRPRVPRERRNGRSL